MFEVLSGRILERGNHTSNSQALPCLVRVPLALVFVGSAYENPESLATGEPGSYFCDERHTKRTPRPKQRNRITRPVKGNYLLLCGERRETPGSPTVTR